MRLMIVALLLALMLIPNIAQADSKYDINFDVKPSLDHVCLYLEITNKQLFDDNFPFKTILNNTGIDVDKVTSRLWEYQYLSKYKMLCDNCTIKECWEDYPNGTKAGCNELPITSCNLCGSHVVQINKWEWVEKTFVSGIKDITNNEIRNSFDSISITNTETKKYKLCYYFNEIPKTFGSHGTIAIDIKDNIYYDLTNSSWWNISYNFRYRIIANATIPTQAININGSNNPNIWTQNKSEPIYLYCTTPNCDSGNIAIANTTSELDWENGTSRTGLNPRYVFTKNSFARLHFDSNDSLAYDSDLNNNTFQLLGSPIKTDYSIFGKALDLNGVNQQAYYDGMQGSGNMSVCFWLYPKQFASNQIVGKQTGTTPATIEWYINIEGFNETRHGYQFVVSSGSSTHCIVRRNNFPANIAPLYFYQWNHICMIRNDTGCYGFINGELDGINISDLSGSPRVATDRIRIGARHDGRYVNGTYDEFIYVNYSMGNSEIRTLFQSRNFTMGIIENYDIDPPIINFVPPTIINGITTLRDTFINLTLNETGKNCLLEWEYVNETMNGSGFIFYANKTGLSNGNYTFSAYCIDNQDNLGFNGTYWVIINYTAPPIPPIAPTNVSLTCDICKDLPIKRISCFGNYKVTLRERTSCSANGCFVSNQTDVLYCAYGCEDNLTSIGADCIPTTFETFYTGWGLFLIALVALLFIAFKLKQKKRKNQRFI